MTNRSEIEALAETCDSVTRRGADTEAPTWTFTRFGLHEFARRLQPARVPEGWRIERDETVAAIDIIPPRDICEGRRIAASAGGTAGLLYALADAVLSAAPAPDNWTEQQKAQCDQAMEVIREMRRKAQCDDGQREVVDWITDEMTGSHLIDQVRMRAQFGRIEDDEIVAVLSIALKRLASAQQAGTGSRGEVGDA